ncbi:hypothetical protein [Nocardia sp. NPDC005366]|uniref:hypothetical protein n=1 Tax=Nocardia sp. NPDC005366 TaxID=3156878 RepID=UPI0033B1BF3A
MAISIIVQDQIHEKHSTTAGLPAVTLADIVLDAPVGSIMRGIHKYADTMFNSYQLKFFLEELTEFEPKNSAESELISVLRSASEEAIRIHGYLWFSGD